MNPTNIQKALQEALALHRAGKLAQAKKAYRKVLKYSPRESDALHLLGVATKQTGDPLQGIELIRRAIEISPSVVQYYLNLALAYVEVENWPAAVRTYTHAITINPNLAEGHERLGDMLSRMGLIQESLNSYRRAHSISGDQPDLLHKLAGLLTRQEDLDAATEMFHKAIRLKPDDAQLHASFAESLHYGGQIQSAISELDRAIELDPSDPTLQSWRIFTMQLDHRFTATDQLAAQREWYNRYASAAAPLKQPHANARDPNKRLRIGYISGDLRDHVVGRNILPLLANHNHDDFEIFCYLTLVNRDPFAARLQSCADHWEDISKLNYSQAAQRVREDQIDILVDLSLHTGDNGLMIFAAKPAPLQFTFAAYPGGTGLSTIDYRISDSYLDPPEYADNNYVEKTLRLQSFWCYNPDAMGVIDFPVAPLPATRNGHITFGSLNNFGKVNDCMVDLWAEVLSRVPKSKLLMLAPRGSHRDYLLSRFASHGVMPDRIDFVSRKSRNEYLQYFNLVDICLDTLPYNGHTTSLDAMWMGVPVVTLVGTTVVGRAGWSQLSNLNLHNELAASDGQRFVEIAVTLANDLPRLSKLRATLRERMLASPLTDAKRFARDIETLYRQIWQQWCAAPQTEQ